MFWIGLAPSPFTTGWGLGTPRLSDEGQKDVKKDKCGQ